jgi:hypothetical protein
MGDKGGGGNDANDMVQQIAMREYKEALPLKRGILERGQEFMEGGFDPTQMPVYNVGRQGIESQYDVARQNILGGMPKGGQMYDRLADMEVQRANQIGGLGAQIAQDEYNKLYGVATGEPLMSMGTLASVAGSQAGAQAQQQAGKYGMTGALGQGAGGLLGSVLPSK